MARRDQRLRGGRGQAATREAGRVRAGGVRRKGEGGGGRREERERRGEKGEEKKGEEKRGERRRERSGEEGRGEPWPKPPETIPQSLPSASRAPHRPWRLEIPRSSLSTICFPGESSETASPKPYSSLYASLKHTHTHTHTHTHQGRAGITTSIYMEHMLE